MIVCWLLAVHSLSFELWNANSCKLSAAKGEYQSAMAAAAAWNLDLPAHELVLRNLLSHLSDQDPSLTRESLLERSRLILQKTLSDVTSQLAVERKEAASRGMGSSSDSAVLVIQDLQLLEPRGRFKLSLSTQGILLEGKAESLFARWDNVASAAVVPSSNSSKKEGEDVLALSLGCGVPCGKKEVSGLLVVLSKSPNSAVKALGLEGTHAEVLPTAMGRYIISPIVRPDKKLFNSCRSQSFLRCYRGTQEGTLYPLRSGLLFVRPMLFVPAESVNAISIGRGGNAATRYVDIKVNRMDS